MFELHPQLASDCVVLGDLPLCRVLMIDDANWTWVLLVPRRVGISEIHQLESEDCLQLTRESVALARTLSMHFNAERVNVAALGNRVPQLHVHHIVRHQNDPAWPAPVWDKVGRKPFEPAARLKKCASIMRLLADQCADFNAATVE